MDDQRRNKLIVGGVVGLVVVVLIILVATKSSDPACELQETQPAKPADLSKVKTIIAAANNALLKFSGYVRYELDPKSEDKKVYLALEDAKSVVLSKAENQSSILIGADCAGITLTIVNSTTAKDKLQIGQVSMDLVRPNGDKRTCTMNFGIVYSKNKHYSCDKEKSYPCTAKGKDKDNSVDTVTTIATLFVNNLELEIDGNPANTKEGKFSTDEEKCK